MPLPKDQAWFRAKRYGYGWGLPLRWQGWLVLAIYVFSLLFTGLHFGRPRGIEFGVYLTVFTLLLVAICAWKGERPKWRWGGSSDDDKQA